MITKFTRCRKIPRQRHGLVAKTSAIRYNKRSNPKRGNAMTKSAIARVLSVLLVILLCMDPAMPVRADASGSVREAILSCYSDQQESADLSAWQITRDQLEESFRQLQYGGALPWYADRYSCRYDTTTGYVTDFTPLNLDETVYDRDLYEQQAARILAETVYPGMSAWQIALSVHDYLAANFCYDTTSAHHEGYDLLVGGSAVCEGYSEAYMDLLNRAGVPCVMVISKSMNHSWNLVSISGHWYHVDVTWDDPSPNIQGRVGHDFFLLSDSRISDESHEHEGWETDIACSNTALDTGRFWQDVTSQICYADADTSFVRYLYPEERLSRICRRDESTGKMTPIAEMPMDYIDLGQGSCWYENHGLTLWNNRLYYSDMTQICSMDLSGGDPRTELRHDAAGHGTYIRGSFVTGGCIDVTLSTIDGALTEVRHLLEDIPFHTHSYVPAVTEATCTAPGYTIYTCSCGLSYTGSRVPALEHEFEAAPSLFGPRPSRCIRCGTVGEPSPVSGEETVLPPNGAGPSRTHRGILPTLMAWYAAAWKQDPRLTGILTIAALVLLRRMLRSRR